MSLGILIALGILAVTFMIFKIGDVFSPWFITVIIWFGILLMFQFDTLLYPLGDRFYTSIMLWVPIFCTASMLTYYALPSGVSDREQKKMESIDINSTIFNVLFYLSLVMTPLYLYRIMQTIMMFDTADMLYNLRVLAVHGEESYGILNYTYVINMSLLAVGIWHYPKIPLWKLLAIYFVCSISAFAIMEKGMIFYFLAATVFVLYEKRVIKMRTILIWGVVIVVLFFLMNMARDSSGLDEDERMTFLDFLAIYILSPSVAYERISEDMSGQWGTNTFYTIYLFLNCRVSYGCPCPPMCTPSSSPSIRISVRRAWRCLPCSTAPRRAGSTDCSAMAAVTAVAYTSTSCTCCYCNSSRTTSFKAA